MCTIYCKCGYCTTSLYISDVAFATLLVFICVNIEYKVPQTRLDKWATEQCVVWFKTPNREQNYRSPCPGSADYSS